jgi:hypothetical protein
MKLHLILWVTSASIFLSHLPGQTCFAQAPGTTVENIDLSDLSKDPSQWPNELFLLEKTDFPVIIGGRESGVITAPKGAKVKLIELIDSKVKISYNGVVKVIPTESTDLLARVISAHKQSEVAQSPNPSPTPHPAKGAMRAAIQLYPDLVKKDSAFYLLFLDLLDHRKKTDPASLTQPDWPLDLAQETAKKLGVQPSTATNGAPNWIEQKNKQSNPLDKGAYNEKKSRYYNRRVYY